MRSSRQRQNTIRLDVNECPERGMHLKVLRRQPCSSSAGTGGIRSKLDDLFATVPRMKDSVLLELERDCQRASRTKGNDGIETETGEDENRSSPLLVGRRTSV